MGEVRDILWRAGRKNAVLLIDSQVSPSRGREDVRMTRSTGLKKGPRKFMC
jgi:hypothetical protein